MCRDADVRFDALRKCLTEDVMILGLRKWVFDSKFYMNLHLVHVALAGQMDLIGFSELIDLQNMFFDLGWENVDAAYYKHVIAASGDSFQAAHCIAGAG